MDWGLTQTKLGGPMIAVNATLGLAVEIDPGDLAVRRSVSFQPSAAAGITLAKFGHTAAGPVGRRVVASSDGSAIFAAGPGGIVRIATADLAVTGRFLEGQGVDAIAVTADGTALYALLETGGRIVKLDAVSGAALGEVAGSGFDRLVAIIPW
jgi:DNA-binding beta-propeller fold protein YncE